MSPLHSSVQTQETGPAVLLSGEADITSAEQLEELLASAIGRVRHRLTVDVSDLRFADSATIQVLLAAAKMLREHGGELVLDAPQQPVARVLELMGADQVITVVQTPQA